MKRHSFTGLLAAGICSFLAVSSAGAEWYSDYGNVSSGQNWQQYQFPGNGYNEWGYTQEQFGKEQYVEDSYFEEPYTEYEATYNFDELQSEQGQEAENKSDAEAETGTESETQSESESESESERGKSDEVYGENEAHERRKPEDGYLYRNNPEESVFEDFDILTTKDAEEQFNLLLFMDLPASYTLDVPEVLQRPELPTGCESVALTMALKYYGFELTKTEIAAEFLIYNLENENAAIGFIGDPFDTSGAGCFAPALAATADNFFIDQEYNYAAFDITGTNFETLFSYVAADTPVLVWTTMYMQPVEFTEEFGIYNGREYRWYRAEHCVVLTGYDLEHGTVQINDPLEGIVTRDMDDFKEIYEEVGEYAVVLKDMTGNTVIE